jgi:hypothetical protein
MLKNQTFLAPLLPFWEKGLGDEGRILVYVFALNRDPAEVPPISIP